MLEQESPSRWKGIFDPSLRLVWFIVLPFAMLSVSLSTVSEWLVRSVLALFAKSLSYTFFHFHFRKALAHFTSQSPLFKGELIPPFFEATDAPQSADMHNQIRL